MSVHSTGTSEFFLAYLFGKTLTTKLYFTPHTICTLENPLTNNRDLMAYFFQSPCEIC